MSTHTHKSRFPMSFLTSKPRLIHKLLGVVTCLIQGEAIFHNEWEKNYKATTTQATSTITVSDNNPTVSSYILIHDKSSATFHTSKYFAELDTFGNDIPVSGDPVVEWLSSPPISSVNDPIMWWSMMEAVDHPLAQMALDFLSALGMFYLCFQQNIILNKINSILNRYRKSLFSRRTHGFKNTP
jgi:hypothetical protein